MSDTDESSPSRLFYGWRVAGAICLVLTIASGLAFYNLSVLLDAFITQKGFPVTLTSGATASFFVASGLGGVIAARLMDRFDPRWIMIGGACVSSLALAVIGWLRNPGELYAFHLIFGFCYGFSGLVPATTIVTRWFEAHRPLALSVASTGLSLGGILLTPVSALLVERAGLAGAAPWLALAYFVGVVPVVALIVRASPQEMGLEPDGRGRAVATSRRSVARSVSFARARRSRFFIGVAASYVFILGAQVGAIAHLFRLVNIRENAAAAAFAVSVMAATSLASRLAGGWLLLRLPSWWFAVAMFVIQTASLALIALADSHAFILAGVMLFGVTLGNILMLQPLLLVEAFGIRDYGRIYSLSQLIVAWGVAGGPILIGVINETTGSYTVPYLAAAGCSAAGLAILILARPHPRESAVS